MKFFLSFIFFFQFVVVYSQSKIESFQDKKTNLYGYKTMVNKKMQIVIPAQFTYAGSFEKGCAVVSYNQKFGLINKNGTLILDTIYLKILMTDHRVYQLLMNDFVGLADTNGKIIVPVEFKRISLNKNSSRIIVDKQTSAELINDNGDVLLELIGGSIGFDGDFVYLSKDNLNAVATMDGKIIYDFQKTDFDSHGSLIKITKNRRIGFGNSFGKIIIPIQYAYATGITNHRFEIYDGNNYAYFDENGKQLTEFIYSIAYGFTGDYTLVMRNSKYGFIDFNGKEIAWGYDEADMPYANISRVMKNSMWGYMDKNGIEIVPLIFDSVSPIDESFPLSFGFKNSKWGIINFADENLNPNPKLEFDSIKVDATLLSECNSVVCFKSNKAGMLAFDDNFQNPIVAYSFNYDSINYFNYLYNEVGEIVIRTFSNGNVNIYDKHRKKITKESYKSVEEVFSSSEYLVRLIVKNQDDKYGLMDYTGKVSIKFAYDTLINREDLMYDGEISVLEVRKNGKCGLFSYTGKEMVPIQYDSIVIKPTDLNMDFSLFCYGTDLIQIYDYDLQAILPSRSQEIVFNFPNADFSYEGWVKVKKDGFYGLFSIGERVWFIPNYYDDIQIIMENQAILLKQKGKYGVFNMDSNELKYKCIYDDFFYQEDENGMKMPKLKLGNQVIDVMLFD